MQALFFIFLQIFVIESLFPFYTFLFLPLIFQNFHAILSPDVKPEKPRSYKGFADFRRRSYINIYASAAFVRCSCKHARLTHCYAKMNRVFVTFHT